MNAGLISGFGAVRLSRPTTSIVNFYSGGGVSSGSTLSSGAASNSRDVLSGPLTANELRTVLAVTGCGEVPLLFARTQDATSRTMRVRVTVDGVVVFDPTSNAIAAANQGVVAMGQPVSTGYIAGMPPGILFNTSLVVDMASSLSETDKLILSYTLNRR